MESSSSRMLLPRKLSISMAEEENLQWLEEKGNKELLVKLGIDMSELLKPIYLPDIGFSTYKLDALRISLMEGFNAVKPASMKLYSCAWPHPFEKDQLLYGGGYNSYTRTPHGVRHKPGLQALVTLLISSEEVYLFGCVLPHLHELTWRAQQMAGGRKLHRVHVLWQGPRGKHKQATFGWHKDDETEDSTQVSMVFNLTNERSAMAVACGATFTYERLGSGCLFPSELYHCTVIDKLCNETMKIAFFFVGLD